MPDTALFTAVISRRADLIGLTQDLIRIPTRNPPGQNYRQICEYPAARLAAQRWEIDFIRAIGAPGDSAAHPRRRRPLPHRDRPPLPDRRRPDRRQTRNH